MTAVRAARRARRALPPRREPREPLRQTPMTAARAARRARRAPPPRRAPQTWTARQSLPSQTAAPPRETLAGSSLASRQRVVGVRDEMERCWCSCRATSTSTRPAESDARQPAASRRAPRRRHCAHRGRARRRRALEHPRADDRAPRRETAASAAAELRHRHRSSARPCRGTLELCCCAPAVLVAFTPLAAHTPKEVRPTFACSVVVAFHRAAAGTSVRASVPEHRRGRAALGRPRGRRVASLHARRRRGGP